MSLLIYKHISCVQNCKFRRTTKKRNTATKRSLGGSRIARHLRAHRIFTGVSPAKGTVRETTHIYALYPRDIFSFNPLSTRNKKKKKKKNKKERKMRKVPERGTPRFYELLDPRRMQRRSNFDKIPDPLVRLSSKQRVTWKLYARTIVEHISFSRGPIHQRWNVDDRHGDDEEDEEDDEKDEEGEKDDVFARRSSGFAMLRFRESIPLERSSRERLNRGHWPLLLRQILNEAVRRQLTNNFGTSTAWPESAFYLLISLLQSAFEHIMRCSRSYDSRYSPDTGGRGQCFSVALSSLLFNLIRLRADALLRSP